MIKNFTKPVWCYHEPHTSWNGFSKLHGNIQLSFLEIGGILWELKESKYFLNKQKVETKHLRWPNSPSLFCQNTLGAGLASTLHSTRTGDPSCTEYTVLGTLTMGKSGKRVKLGTVWKEKSSTHMKKSSHLQRTRRVTESENDPVGWWARHIKVWLLCSCENLALNSDTVRISFLPDDSAGSMRDMAWI